MDHDACHCGLGIAKKVLSLKHPPPPSPNLVLAPQSLLHQPTILQDSLLKGSMSVGGSVVWIDMTVPRAFHSCWDWVFWYCSAGCLLLLVITCLTLSHAAVSGPSLHDVINQRDRSRMRQLLVSEEPYNDLQTAYFVARALDNLGFSDSNKLVSWRYYPCHEYMHTPHANTHTKHTHACTHTTHTYAHACTHCLLHCI